MKNVILTHKELQMNMFVAFADAMCHTLKVPKGYFLTWSSNAHAFAFELWKSASEIPICGTSSPENLDGKRIILYDGMNKGDSEMNDIRLGVMVPYWRSHAEKFINQVELFLNHQIERSELKSAEK